jgi:hypothetical protein
MSLKERMEAVAQAVTQREALHADDVAGARARADALFSQVSTAVEGFNAVVAEQIPDLRVSVRPPRIDDKHLHATQFDLERGRHRAIVTVKSKGEVTLVGPFRAGKNEGPCRSFPFDAGAELEDALGDFLERFLEEAVAP